MQEQWQLRLTWSPEDELLEAQDWSLCRERDQHSRDDGYEDCAASLDDLDGQKIYVF